MEDSIYFKLVYPIEDKLEDILVGITVTSNSTRGSAVILDGMYLRTEERVPKKYMSGISSFMLDNKVIKDEVGDWMYDKLLIHHNITE